MSQITVSESQIRNYQAEAGVKLRIYCRRTFTASDDAVVVRGTIDADDFYAEVDCAVSGEVITVDAFTIDSTEDGSPDSSYYTFGLYDSGGDRIALPSGLEKIKVPASPTTTTLGALITHNQANCECLDDTYYTAAQVDEILEGYNDNTLVATTVIRGVSKLNFAAEDVDDPYVVSDNYPPIRVLRERKYLEEYSDSLTAAIADIGSDDAVLVVSKPQQFERTASTVTGGSLVVDEYYEILTYPGEVTYLERTDGGTGYSTATNVPTLGGSGSGLTVDITFVVGGVITGVEINNPGTDYEVGDIVTIDDGNGDAKLMVRVVEGDDFENVGSDILGFASSFGNRAGAVFKATGTSPTTWTNGTILRKYLKVPSNIKVEFEANGSLYATGTGGGIYIESLIPPFGNQQIFESDGDGKILINQRSVIASNVAWWAGSPSGTDDTHAFVQARDSTTYGWYGGKVNIPIGDWKVDAGAWQVRNHTWWDGMGGTAIDGGQWGSCVYPADLAALYHGVLEFDEILIGVKISNMLITSDTSLTVNAVKWKPVMSTSQNLTFDHVRFENVTATDGAVPLTVFVGESSFEEFVNFNYKQCSWTANKNGTCISWESTNAVAHFTNPQFRFGVSGYGVYSPYAGYLTFNTPEFRGPIDDLSTTYELTPVEDRSVASAASCTNGTKVVSLSSGSVDREDLGRLIRITGKTFETRAYTYITKINTPTQFEIYESIDSTATNLTIAFDDLGDNGACGNACFYLEDHIQITVVNPSDEAVNYVLRDNAADYSNTFNIIGGKVQGKILFENGATQFTAVGTAFYSGAFNNDGANPIARLFGGIILDDIVPRMSYVYEFPDFRELLAAEAWHLCPNYTDFAFDSSIKEGDRQLYQYNVIKEPTRFIHKNNDGGINDDEGQVLIGSPHEAGGPNKYLLQLANTYYGSDEPRYSFFFYRDTITGHLSIAGDQVGFADLDIIGGSLNADTDVTAGNDMLADRDIIAQRALKVAAKASSTAGVGYSTGAGDTQTQGTSKATGVTSNALTGLINSHASSISDGTDVTFRVTNSCVKNEDGILLTAQMASGAEPTSDVKVIKTADGYFDVMFRNRSGGADANEYYIRYYVIKGAFA